MESRIRRMVLLAGTLLATATLAQSDPAGAPAEAPAAPPAATEPAPPTQPPEDEPASGPAPSAAKPVARPAQKPPAQQPSRPTAAPPPAKAPAANPLVESISDEEAVAYEARLFFMDVLSSDARGLAQRATFPFHLEDRRYEGEDELFAVWLKNLQRKRTDLLSLYGIEVLSAADMESKYGKPPARLASFPYKGPRTWIAVANLSGRAAVVVFKPVNNRWRAVAYHD